MITNGKIWICALFLAGFWACSDDSENLNQEITAEDIENASTIDEASIPFMDAVTVSNEILSDEAVITGRTLNCYAVESTPMENQLLVSFESNCTGIDGKIRSGNMLIEWTGSEETNNFSYTVVFDGYEVDGYGLAGSITVSNLTVKENGFGFNVLVNDGIVTCPDGKQIMYEQDFNYDFSFAELLELRITGSTTGAGKEGNTYTANIKKPILVVSGCDHAVSGSFDASFNGRPAVTVDYGDGTCDNKAIASRGDHSLSFELD
jgi:hypothetical protein